MKVASRDTNGTRDMVFLSCISGSTAVAFFSPSLIAAMTSVTLCWFRLPFVRRNSPCEKNPQETDMSWKGWIS